MIALAVSLAAASSATAAEVKGRFVPFGSGFDDVVRLKGSPIDTGAVAAAIKESPEGQFVALRAYTKSGREDFEWGEEGQAAVLCEGIDRSPSLAAGPNGSLFVLCDERIHRLSSSGSVDNGFGDDGSTEVLYPPVPSDPRGTYTTYASQIAVVGDKLFVAGFVSRQPDPRPVSTPWLARYELSGAPDESYGDSGFRSDGAPDACATYRLTGGRANRVFTAGSTGPYGCYPGGGIEINDWGILGAGPFEGLEPQVPENAKPQLADLALINGTDPVTLSKDGVDGTFALADAGRFRTVDLGAPGRDVALTSGGRGYVVGVGVAAQGLDLRAFNARLRPKSQIDVPLPDGWSVEVREIVRLKNHFLVAGDAVANGDPGGFAARVRARPIDPR